MADRPVTSSDISDTNDNEEARLDEFRVLSHQSSRNESDGRRVAIVFSFNVVETSAMDNLGIPILISPGLIDAAAALNVLFTSTTARDGTAFAEFMKKVQKRQEMKRQLKKSKPYVYRKGMARKECSICLNKFAIKNKIRRLNCKHEFHKNCVDQWLLKGEMCCPICRKEPFLDPIER